MYGTKLFALSQQFWSLDKVMTLHPFMSGNVQMVWGFCSILNVPDLIDNRKSQTSYYAVSGDQFSVIQSKLYVRPPFVSSLIIKTPKFSQSNHYNYLELLVKSHISKVTASSFLDEHFRIFHCFYPPVRDHSGHGLICVVAVCASLLTQGLEFFAYKPLLHRLTAH